MKKMSLKNKLLFITLTLFLSNCGGSIAPSIPIKRIFVEQENNLWSHIKNILDQKLSPEGFFDKLPQESIDNKFDGANLLHLLVSYKDRQKDYEVVVKRINKERLIEKNRDGKTPYVLAYMERNLELYDVILKRIKEEKLVSDELLIKLKLIQEIHLTDIDFVESIPMLSVLTETEDGEETAQFDLAFSLADMIIKENKIAESNFKTAGGDNNVFAQRSYYSLNIADTSGKGDTSLGKLYGVCKNSKGNWSKLLPKLETILENKIKIEGEEIYLCDVSTSYDVAGKLSYPLIVKVASKDDWSLLDRCLDILLSYKGKELLLEKAIDSISENRTFNLLEKCLENIETRNIFKSMSDPITVLGKICQNANNYPNNVLSVRLLKKASKIGFNFLSLKIYNKFLDVKALSQMPWEQITNIELKAIVNKIRKDEGIIEIDDEVIEIVRKTRESGDKENNEKIVKMINSYKADSEDLNKIAKLKAEINTMKKNFKMAEIS